MLRALIFAAISFLGGVGTAAADAVLDLDRLLAKTNSLQAMFSQTVYDERNRAVQAAEGRVSLQRPGRFRWDYAPPVPQLIVGDGERVWLYDRELEQVTVRGIDSALDDTPALLLTHVGSVRQIFVATALAPEGDLSWVKLVPREDSASFLWIRVGIDSKQIRVMKMADSFGQTTELRFSDAAVNTKLDAKLFSFLAPQGTDTIEGQ